jgi:multidrug resistance protein
MSLTTSRASTEGHNAVPSSDLEKQDTHLTHTSTRRTLERYETRPTQGASDVLDLPYGTLNESANMNEFTEETAEGIIPKRTISRASGRVEDHELVTFTINDPENPKNFTKLRKWYCTMVVALTCFVVAFNSSVITANIEGVSEEFNVSEEVALLTITVFVIGFGVGPLAFAPCSELFGRRPVYIVTLAIAFIFIIPCAVAQNIGTLIVCRLIDGIAFSAPMTLVGGTLADLWRSEERGVPMAFFSAAPFIGPAIGPLVGGYLGTLGWRWLYYIQLILSGVAWLLITFTVPETYAPKLLTTRAKKLRKETGEAKYVTETELDIRPFSERLRIFLIRPLQLLFLEPIVLFISIYMSVLYGLLYMFFVAYPIGTSSSPTILLSTLTNTSSHSLPRRQRLVRRLHRPDVHPLGARRRPLRNPLPTRQRTLPNPRGPRAQQQPPRRSAPHPHDVLLLGDPRRPVHLRVDLLPFSLLLGPHDGRLPGRVRLHLPVQLGQQLPG